MVKDFRVVYGWKKFVLTSSCVCGKCREMPYLSISVHRLGMLPGHIGYCINLCSEGESNQILGGPDMLTYPLVGETKFSSVPLSNSLTSVSNP